MAKQTKPNGNGNQNAKAGTEATPVADQQDTAAQEASSLKDQLKDKAAAALAKAKEGKDLVKQSLNQPLPDNATASQKVTHLSKKCAVGAFKVGVAFALTSVISAVVGGVIAHFSKPSESTQEGSD